MPILDRVPYTAGRAGQNALVIALVVSSVANMLFGMGGFGFINGNESLYVEAAREMLRAGGWVVPTLNGLPYLEKPPLLDWLLVAVFRVAGVSEFAARSVSVMASVACAVALARFSPLLRVGGAPWLAAYVYLTSLGVVLMSSVVMPDALLNSLFGIACLAFAAALRTRERRFVRLAGLALGLACLTKGLLPLVVFGLILVAYAAVKRTRTDLRLILGLARDPVAWTLLVGPLLAWIVAAEVVLPGAAYRFVIDEHLLRFLGSREPHDYYTGSLFYYVPRLFLFAFPWAGVVIFGWAARRREKADECRDTRHFLWACVWVPFAFFSLSQAKANYYVTLSLAPLALLTADYLQLLLRKKQATLLILSIAVPTLALVAVEAVRAWAVASGRTPRLLEHPDGSFAMTRAGILMLCLTLLGLAQFGWRKTAAFALGGLIVPVTFLLHHLATSAGPQISAKEMANHIKSTFPDAPVFLYRDYEAYGALPIYLERNIPVVDSHSNDLYFGRQLRPDHPSLVGERAVLDSEGALIVVLAEREKAFRRSGLSGEATAVFGSGRATLYRLARRP